MKKINKKTINNNLKNKIHKGGASKRASARKSTQKSFNESDTSLYQLITSKQLVTAIISFRKLTIRCILGNNE